MTIIFAVEIFFISIVHAEIKTYEGVGEYIAGDFEKIDAAKERAKSRAIQAAKEKAGIFFKSYIKVINAQLAEQDIISVTNIFAKEIETDFESSSVQVSKTSGIMYRAKVKVEIDTDEILHWLRLPEEVRNLFVNMTEEARNAAEENNAKIFELKRQLSNTKNKIEQEKIRQEIEKINNAFLSNLMMDEGTKFFQLGNFDSAIEKYNAALKLNPENSYVYNNRALAYHNAGNFKAALDDYSILIQLEPNLVNAYVNRGLIYMDLNDYNQALADFNFALSIDPNLINAYNNRGLTYYRMNEYDKALADYRKTLELNPNFAYAHNNIGTLYFSQQKYFEARDEFNKAIAIAPNYGQAWFNHANVYFMLNDLEQAIADYSKAIELIPNYADAYFRRGRCYYNIGKNDLAQADFEKAKSLGFQF